MATAPGNNSSDLTDFGANDWLIEEMYEAYSTDPDSVDPAWREFFAARAEQTPPGASTTAPPPQVAAPAPGEHAPAPAEPSARVALAKPAAAPTPPPAMAPMKVM